MGTHNLWVLKVCDETKLQVDGRENQNTCILCISFKLFFYTYPPEDFAVILKKRFYHRVMHSKDSDSIANSESPNQTAPLGVVRSRSALYAQTYLS